MNKTRLAVKCLAGAVATTALVLGSLAAPAQAASDKAADGSGRGGPVSTMKDTGWG
jgi:hypothetical protein